MNINLFGSKTGKRVTRSIGGDVLVLASLTLVAAFMSLPFVYSIMQSLKPMEEIFIFPPRFFVRRPTLDNFALLASYANGTWIPFTRYIANSVVVTVVGTFSHVLISSMAAFVLSKCNIRFRKTIFAIIVASLMFMGDVTVIPLYIVMSNLRIINSIWALILPGIAAPLGLFLMKQFMEIIPNATLDSAKIDGANSFGIYANIIMPMAKPAWLTLIIFSFQNFWNREGQMFLYNEELKVFPTVLRQISSAGISRAGSRPRRESF
jgi:putative chitobiose transport system permease protein